VTENHGLSVPKNKVTRLVSGSKTQGGQNYAIKELHNLYATPIIMVIKTRGIG
jgi:hypothetical protein